MVHSFKDLPSAPLAGLVVAAVPERADPRDALCAGDRVGLAGLAQGARIGTSSPRRDAGLRRVRPDLQIVPVRGNVDTRLRKVGDGQVDAVVLAAAGLQRLGRGDAITELLDPDVCVPAPAQGALAVECRVGTLEAALASLDDQSARLAVTAERAVLAGVEAACTTAVGAYAVWRGAAELELLAELTDHRGVGHARSRRRVRVTTSAEAEALGLAVARELLAG